jgi:hypothetical protein
VGQGKPSTAIPCPSKRPTASQEEPAGRPTQRVYARPCGLCVKIKHVGELSDVQIQKGGQPFSLEPELQMCRTCSTDEQQSFAPVTPIDSAPVAP